MVAKRINGNEKDVVDVDTLVENITKINEYQRTVIVIEEDISHLSISIHNIIEEGEKISARNLLVSDKLLHTLGIKKDDAINKIIA